MERQGYFVGLEGCECGEGGGAVGVRAISAFSHGQWLLVSSDLI